MGIKSKSNKDYSEILKRNYEAWKRNGLSNGGYFVIFNGFLKETKLRAISGNALKLYIYLGLNSNNMSGEVWHTNKSIAKYFTKSERTIREWMKELEDLNLIKRFQLEFNGISHTYLQPYELEYKTKENPTEFHYMYRLKNVTYRNKTDLRLFSDSIITGIKNTFPMAKVNVYHYFFEFFLSEKASDMELRMMGHEIRKSNKEFDNLVVTYNYKRSDGSDGVSVQLFEKLLDSSNKF
jgi:DNA-binding Lrp family transcriptional regulator